MTFESLRKMLENGEPEVEEIKGKIPVTEVVDFEVPSVQRKALGGIQKIWRFKNGFGASVVQHFGSYGNEQGLWELAVLKFDETGDWTLTCETEITEDVIGHLNPREVAELLQRIAELKA